jgi:hypothetical protein
MHPGKDGEPVCSFKGSHASMRKQQLRRVAEQADAKKKR